MNPILSQPLQASLETAVSDYTHRPWRVNTAQDMSEFACHPCAILSDGSFAVFAKYSPDAAAAAQFECELASLRYLAARAGVMIPAPVGIVPVENGALFIMEALRLPELCGPAFTPSLLHGDAPQNNFISIAQGTFVIDPAIYHGHPEADLALMDAWQPAPGDFLDGYQEDRPIDPGFRDRRSLWRWPLYLAAVAIEGPVHLARLAGALQEYV